MNDTFHVFDVVALLKNIPDQRLQIGQVGTIVETLAEDVYEVEFANNEGKTIASVAVEAKNLLLLHYECEIERGH